MWHAKGVLLAMGLGLALWHGCVVENEPGLHPAPPAIPPPPPVPKDPPPSQVPPPMPDVFRECQADSDCIAVPRIGCCRNGWNEALNPVYAKAYEKSFTCPTAHPICPMHLVVDRRKPVCDATAHLCKLVAPDVTPVAPPDAEVHDASVDGR